MVRLSHFVPCQHQPVAAALGVLDTPLNVAKAFPVHPHRRDLRGVEVLGCIGCLVEPPPACLKQLRNQWDVTANLGATTDEGSGHRDRLIFADATSGITTYGAGRFLWADAPDAEGHTVLDFNRVYNPPCAFTPFATCPLPPPGNRLDATVAAGERKWRDAQH